MDRVAEPIAEVTERIAARSAERRAAYLEGLRAAAAAGPARGQLGCANLAHGLAACDAERRAALDHWNEVVQRARQEARQLCPSVM